MCSLLRLSTAFHVLASTVLGAVRLHSAGHQQPQGPPRLQPPTVAAPAASSSISGDTHFVNIDTVGWDGIRMPGDYELLRMPADGRKPALLELRGTFLPSENASCGMYMMNVTLKGEWLGGKVIHARWADGFELKVSSSGPPVAGQWSSFKGFDLVGSGLPDTIQIEEVFSGRGLKFLAGPKQIKNHRPVAYLMPGHVNGLDLSLLNTKRLQMPERQRSAACELRVNPLYTIKGDVHTWNLAGEGFEGLDTSGDVSLLQIPKAGPPLLFDVRGTFAATSPGAPLPCALHMTNITLSGKWLGGKVLHVGWLGGLAFKVSSVDPPYAGTWRPLAEFAQALSLGGSGVESLPETVEMRKADDGTGIRFHMGTKSMHLRPTLHVKKGPIAGLDYSVFYTAIFDNVAAEPPSLLGTERQDKEQDARVALCRALRQNASDPRIPDLPTVSAS